ncbi:hypothetical protein [Nostoc sp. LPT]|uniref:hypothetical protein n=1 Tax=Nostoc sp. LPT TaxID=2815387 RepID=UPI001DA736B3|nr:hypothetical protein [Nostoc sp. LPT]MBN4004729.1 hypothetical protein [Nostoc sp. LPT]
MQVYLNVLPANKGDSQQNEVILLDTLTRRDILGQLENALKCPSQYFLGGAESIQSIVSIYDDEKKYLTLTEYLEQNNIVVSEGSFHLLATRVAKEFVREYGQKPKRVHRPSPVTGKNNNKAYGYNKDELHIIDKVLAAIPHVKNPRK